MRKGKIQNAIFWSTISCVNDAFKKTFNLPSESTRPMFVIEVNFLFQSLSVSENKSRKSRTTLFCEIFSSQSKLWILVDALSSKQDDSLGLTEERSDFSSMLVSSCDKILALSSENTMDDLVMNACKYIIYVQHLLDRTKENVSLFAYSWITIKKFAHSFRCIPIKKRLEGQNFCHVLATIYMWMLIFDTEIKIRIILPKALSDLRNSLCKKQ